MLSRVLLISIELDFPFRQSIQVIARHSMMMMMRSNYPGLADIESSLAFSSHLSGNERRIPSARRWNAR